jgi:heme-degrading monooxygenase HmoA
MAKSKGIYIRVWEIQAKAGLEDEFEKAFGPEGQWVALFRKSKAFLRTELFRDLEDNGRYFIVDHFASQSAFQSFLKENRDEYDALDRDCERLCASEKRLGSFFEVEGPSPQA